MCCTCGLRVVTQGQRWGAERKWVDGLWGQGWVPVELQLGAARGFLHKAVPSVTGQGPTKPYTTVHFLLVLRRLHVWQNKPPDKTPLRWSSP